MRKNFYFSHYIFAYRLVNLQNIFTLALSTAFFLVFIAACQSATQVKTGIVDNRLTPCPSSPNCVCSETQGLKSSISPVNYKTEDAEAWSKAKSTIYKMGGKIIKQDEQYIHAVFTSRIFHFVDDFELRIDKKNKVIHIRSGSRTGYSDLGVNRKRADKFREIFKVSNE